MIILSHNVMLFSITFRVSEQIDMPWSQCAPATTKIGQHVLKLLAKTFSDAAVDDKVDGRVDNQQKVVQAQHDVHQDRNGISEMIRIY